MSCLVVGDVLLDRDLDGTATRISPDGPVPVVEQRNESVRAGGAGLTASLLRRMSPDVPVVLVTALARDDAGRLLQRELDRAGVDVVDLVDGGTTSEKVRIRAGGRTVVRLDRGAPGALGELPPAAATAFADADVVLVADYGRGVARHPGVRALLARAVDGGVPVVWDPHPAGPRPVPGTTLVLPNVREAGLADPDAADLARVDERARALRRRWKAGAVAVTLGAHGALLAAGEGAPLVIPVEGSRAEVDACGAGDAVAAAAALSLARGALVSEAVEHGVARATSFVHDRELRDIGSPSTAVPCGAPDTSPDPSAGAGHHAALRVVATGGCFDVLHAGHVAMLRSARSLGDRLVVLLNSDASVRRLKGEGRPAQSQADRVEVLRSLSCVDEVVVFDEDTPVEALERLRPAVFVKGGDYTEQHLPETAVLERWGGTVVTVPFLRGRSTSRVLAGTPTEVAVEGVTVEGVGGGS